MIRIKERLGGNRNSLLPWKIESDKRLYINFNPDSPDSRWRVELDFELFEKSNFDNDNFDTKKIIQNAIVELLLNFNINTNTHTASNNLKEFETTDLLQYNGLINKIQQHNASNYICLIGDNGCGKSTLVKQFCYNKKFYNSDAKIFWLDFNGGSTNFIDMFYELITLNTSDTPEIFLVLDNLDCCGLDLAQNIFTFFKTITTIVRSHDLYIQLIVIQDTNCLLEYNATDDNTLNISYSEVIRDLINQDLDNETKKPLPYLLNSINKNFEIAKIKKELNLSNTEKRLIYKIILLSSLGILIKLSADEINIARNRLQDFEGLKIYNNNTVTFTDKEYSKLVLAHINNELWFKSGFNEAFNNESHISTSKKIIETYYYRTELSLSTIDKILVNNAYSYVYNYEQNDNLFAYIELVALASKAKAHLIEEINKSHASKQGYFENHLGSILFAAEALAKYEDDWDALSAWKHLAKFVRDTYYINGQSLPEINIGKEDNENTYIDFDNTTHHNSIKNQILLQNEIITAYGNEIDLSDKKNLTDILSENNFRYLIHQSKKNDEDIFDINIDRLYRTYLLSLLYEFEVTAPQTERDRDRISILFNKLKNCIIENEKDDTAYLYPARIPWVSARMLLALCETPTKYLVSIADDIKRYKRRIGRWLANCGYEIPVTDSVSEYMIWLPGTGLWNGVLETTMMCTFALKTAGIDESAIQKGSNYILSQEHLWFNSNSYSDGIWACETLLLNSAQGDSLPIAHEIIKKIRKASLDELFEVKSNKLDRSLGDSHIAKTLISLAYKISQKKPKIFIDKDTANFGNTKVFISFETSTGLEFAQDIYKKLAINSNISPYIYTEEMRLGNWKQQLKNAINISDAFLLIISENTFNSIPVLEEIKLRLATNKPILPIICNDFDISKLPNTVYNILTKSELVKLTNILNVQHNNVINIKTDLDYHKKILQYIAK